MLKITKPLQLPKNTKKLGNIATQAFQQTCRELGEEYKKVIEDSNAFSDFKGQDIVDTGALRDSQQLIFTNKGGAEFSWSVPYSIYVHQGYTLRNGRRQPGRQWTVEGNKRFKFSKRLMANIRSARISNKQR